jgi:hypothetical protein
MLYTRTRRWFQSLGFLGHIHSSLLQGMFYYASAELRKASSVRSRGSSAPNGRILMKFEYFSIIQVSLKSDKRMASLHEGYVHL